MNTQIANYKSEQVDTSARKAIEVMSQTIASLFYGQDFRNEIVQQAKDEMMPQIKQELATSQLEIQKRINDSENAILEKAQVNAENIINSRELSVMGNKRINDARRRKVAEYLGNCYRNDDMWTLFAKSLNGVILHNIKNKFNVKAQCHLSQGMVDEVIAFIDGMVLDSDAIKKWAKKGLDEDYTSGKWDEGKHAKIKAAYERVFLLSSN